MIIYIHKEDLLKPREKSNVKRLIRELKSRGGGV